MTGQPPFHEPNNQKHSRKQNINQEVGRNNQGNFQAVNAGRDANVSLVNNSPIFNIRNYYLISFLFEWVGIKLKNLFTEPVEAFKFLFVCFLIAKIVEKPLELIFLTVVCRLLKDSLASLYTVVFPFSGIILWSASLFTLVLIILWLWAMFDRDYYDNSEFRYLALWEWLRYHLCIIFVYTGLLISNEPSLSIFWENLNSKSYGFERG
jgi:hypothetical protein